MVDAVLDVLFPLVLFAIPALAAIYLAGFVFGRAETMAGVKVVGVVALKALLNVGRRFHRAALAFVSDDAIPSMANFGERRIPFCDAGDLMMEIGRLDDRIDRLREYVSERDEDEVETSTPF